MGPAFPVDFLPGTLNRPGGTAGPHAGHDLAGLSGKHKISDVIELTCGNPRQGSRGRAPGTGTGTRV